MSERMFGQVKQEREEAFNRWTMLRGGPKARQALDELLEIDAEYHEMIRRGEDREAQEAEKR